MSSSLYCPEGSARTIVPTVELMDVHFHYHKSREILWVSELTIRAGERVFLFGPSGSGKTTLLGLVAGVLKATDGSVNVLGTALSRLSSSRRDTFRGAHIGYIFQLFNLIPYLTVSQNIALPCRLISERQKRLQGTSIEQAARQVAERLGIASILEENVGNLSVGQQQRVAAARSLIGTPELVVADEPTSSLDYDQRERFIHLLFENCAAANSTLLFVSHDRTLMPLFDRCVSLPGINKAVM